tara:strand:- start:44852 stop:44995 length:144 start_codon:yes stop_codon:yes gene_type:complete
MSGGMSSGVAQLVVLRAMEGARAAAQRIPAAAAAPVGVRKKVRRSVL